MKLPNAYGSVYKLSGKRRKPWAVRKTVGWKQIPEKKTAYPIYQFLGYYASRAEALQALAAYNADPHDLKLDTITFAEVYKRWSAEYFETIKNPANHKTAYNICKPIYTMRMAEIKLDHLQKLMDDSGKNTPTLRVVKNLWNLMWDYAVAHEIVPQEKRDMLGYLNINKAGNPNAHKRKPFTKKEIAAIWDAEPSNKYISVILMLIYTGVRISELLDLKKEDVHLEEKWFFIRESKTDAGIREVPIADKVVPFFELWMQTDCDYLICTSRGGHFLYINFIRWYWNPLMDKLSISDRTPHCTRHTCISLLAEAGVDERIIQKIVGHRGQSVTQAVYTHIDLPAKLDAINKI